VGVTGAMVGVGLGAGTLALNSMWSLITKGDGWNQDLAKFSAASFAVSCGFFIGFDTFKDVKKKRNKQIVEIYNQKF